MILLIKNELFKINIEIILNKLLYEKCIIDENTYIESNERLIRSLKGLR